MILFMITFLFVYASYRYYKDINDLNNVINELEVYTSMLENDIEWYENNTSEKIESDRGEYELD